MEERLKMIMSQVLGLDASAIGDDTAQSTVKRWDSLGHMNLCAALEEEFGVSFTADQVVAMTSYPALRATVSALTTS